MKKIIFSAGTVRKSHAAYTKIISGFDQKKPVEIPGRFILLFYAIVPVLVSLCLSCASAPEVTSSRSWRLPPENKIAGTVWISNVEADRAGTASFAEKEAASILPLVLSDLNYLALEKKEGADFLVELKIREREFIRGWKTISSLAAEIYIRHGNRGGTKEGISVPLAAGRVVTENSGGLSSSKTLFNLIEKAAKKAIIALEKKQ